MNAKPDEDDEEEKVIDAMYQGAGLPKPSKDKKTPDEKNNDAMRRGAGLPPVESGPKKAD